MSETTIRVLHWTPRIFCVAFAMLLAIFAIDEVSTPGGLSTRALAFSLHLIPAAIVLAGLLIAWRREWIGAVFFPLLAVVHLVMTWGRLAPSAYAAIGGPLLALGILFGLDWRHHRR